ncbi:MAG: molybdopterin biosynthesis protein [Sulfolobales archaeon]
MRGGIVFHRLVSVDEATEILYRTLIELGYPRISERRLLDSLGLIAAEDIYAKTSYPPFDRSTVDGYAVRSIDIAGASEIEPKILRVIGRVSVGEIPLGEVREGSAIEISTGAMIPRGADSIVMIEYTKRSDDNLYVYRSSVPGENISQAGSDISAGDLIIRKGSKITFKEIATIASVGLDRIRVYEPLKISVFSTGVELIPPGADLPAGKVYDINGYSITSFFRELGFEAYYEGILRDDLKEFTEKITSAFDRSDIVVTSGGTSAGYNDLTYKVANEIGAEILFHGIKVRPGRPTLLARYKNKLLIGLPGFPLSSMMILIRVVKPALLKLYGLEDWKSVATVIIPHRIEVGKGVREFIPVAVVETSKGFVAYPIQRGSGSVMSMIIADGFIEVPEDREYLDEGEMLKVNLFTDISKVPELYFIGSHCLGVELILRLSGFRSFKSIYTGSLYGWNAVRRGEADLAGTHLLDEESGEYNLFMIRKLKLEKEVYLVRGYGRRIGFVVRRGNPKNIRGFKDLLRNDVVFVNRNKGSGIRTFTDIMIKKIIGKEDPMKIIRGYTYEVRTHTAVAAAVSQGRADVGIAIEAVSDLYDLDFIPLTEEIYDFVIPRDRIDKKSVQKFIEVLRSIEFRELLPRNLKGYRILPDTGEFLHKPL